MRIASRFLELLNRLADFPALKIELSKFEPNLQVRRKAFGSFLAFRQLISLFLRLDLRSFGRIIRRSGIKLLDLMLEFPNRRICDSSVQRCIGPDTSFGGLDPFVI